MKLADEIFEWRLYIPNIAEQMTMGLEFFLNKIKGKKRKKKGGTTKNFNPGIFNQKLGLVMLTSKYSFYRINMIKMHKFV